MNAHAINAGQFPNIKNGLDTDFFFINQEDADEMVRLIIGLVRDRLPKKYGFPPKEIHQQLVLVLGDLRYIPFSPYL